MESYPLMRYMGSKYKLIPWFYEAFSELEFDSALDAFSGSGVVSYLFKSMDKQVYSNDFLNFPSTISKALIENNQTTLEEEDIRALTNMDVKSDDFIEKTFHKVFYSKDDLVFLDKISHNIAQLTSPYKKALALTALFRSCLKKQPRGVFTISGNLEKYDDGRRDLKISLQRHFLEQVAIYNEVVFDNQQENQSLHSSIFEIDTQSCKPDLVYLDPPYVPASDDNCYVKRYHFLEGLSKYWHGEQIMEDTKVKKIQKKYTPFSYKKTAIEAFENMFDKFSDSIIALSYSSNAFPDLDTLVSLMKNQKATVEVKTKSHRYNFGNHSKAMRANVVEYLIIGKD
ncbi:DNA adenine methylase [Algoriphagus sp. H41]|uniref:site-specific DNA-methyltransferase (adenine-specific) n=1 Tax=Algoriphagus oliviformis TaxID=2811231 RepID=A0ABS3C0R5_9BACT|nr:DNA adenine methylase [Algoriphagus oliviformis]MBN7810495.1 DNA adenine methylase [Algoriphagus oliviformis]